MNSVFLIIQKIRLVNLAAFIRIHCLNKGVKVQLCEILTFSFTNINKSLKLGNLEIGVLIMSWIDIIDEEEADGLLKKYYNEISKRRGKVANIMKVHSLNPRAMKAHFDLYIALLFRKSGLSREERELIATAVSVANGCEYCQLHHGEALLHYWEDQKRLDQFLEDPFSVELSQRAEALLTYAIKLTKEPKTFTNKDFTVLKEHGLSDEDILNVNLIVSYFNFVNRVAVGLGVHFSEEEIKGYNY